MIMKKSLALAAVLGVATLLATPVVGNAAVDPTNSTTATTASVSLTDEDNPMTLTSAPTFNFGSAKIGTAAAVFKNPTVTDNLVVNAYGNSDGWNVNVKSDGFSNSDKSVSLKGDVFYLGAGEVKPVDASNISASPTTSSFELLNDDNPVFTAAKASGAGSWKADFTKSEQLCLSRLGIRPEVIQLT